MSQRPSEDFNWKEQVGAQPFQLRPKNPRLALLMGYLVSQMVGFGALALVTLIFNNFNFYRMGDFATWTAGILGFSQFFLIPFGMGLVAAYFWLDKDRTNPQFSSETNRILARRAVNGSVLLNTLICCVGAAFILKEGVICLLMASPVLCFFMWLGTRAGAHFWNKNPFLGVSLVPIFCFWFSPKLLAPKLPVSAFRPIFIRALRPNRCGDLNQ